MFIYMFSVHVFYVSDFSVYVLFMFCICFCYAEIMYLFGVWRLVVSPRALKPSVGDGIESRGPLCFTIMFHSFSFSHVCTFVGV